MSVHGRRRRVALLVVLMIAGIPAGAYLARRPLLRAMASYLHVEDSLRPSDLMVLLGGENESRPFYAAELYRRSLAPRILLPRIQPKPYEEMGIAPSEAEIAKKILLAKGVPEKAIVTLDREVESTYEEGQALREYLTVHPARRIIVVTSGYHARRARWVMTRALGDEVEVLVAAAPPWRFEEDRWWEDEDGVVTYFEEYLKFLYYLIKY